jgi:hypothetical protein
MSGFMQRSNCKSSIGDSVKLRAISVIKDLVPCLGAFRQTAPGWSGSKGPSPSLATKALRSNAAIRFVFSAVISCQTGDLRVSIVRNFLVSRLRRQTRRLPGNRPAVAQFPYRQRRGCRPKCSFGRPADDRLDVRPWAVGHTRWP